MDRGPERRNVRSGQLLNLSPASASARPSGDAAPTSPTWSQLQTLEQAAQSGEAAPDVMTGLSRAEPAALFLDNAVRQGQHR
jgi:hypothetical protein